MGQALRLLAVDAEDFFEIAGDIFHITFQFVLVGMAGIGVEGNDLGADVARVAKKNVFIQESGNRPNGDRALVRN